MPTGKHCSSPKFTYNALWCTAKKHFCSIAERWQPILNWCVALTQCMLMCMQGVKEASEAFIAICVLFDGISLHLLFQGHRRKSGEIFPDWWAALTLTVLPENMPSFDMTKWHFRNLQTFFFLNIVWQGELFLSENTDCESVARRWTSSIYILLSDK